jgi:hypothetical protein
MKCFHDPTQDAVGICRGCGKALSREHLVDLDKGLACKGHCEDYVRQLIALNDSTLALSAKTQNIIQSSGRDALIRALFTIILGAIFAGASLLYSEHPDPFFVSIGIAFTLWGLLGLFRAISLQRAKS